MKPIYLTVFLLVFMASVLPVQFQAQEMVLVVERCKALNQTSPIHNIWVDEENVKWVANTEGLHKVLAIDLVQKASVPTGSTNLLTIRGGNSNLTWNTSEMQSLLGNATISTASYDPKSKSLWIGTQQEGAFQVALSPLRIMQRFNTDNRKLTSNQINDIFIASNGTTWIATNDGMLSGSGDKWTLQERYLNFVGVDAWGQNMWILGDDFLWQVDAKGKWTPIAIELKNVEGQLRDIAVDDEGRVWIASNMMTGYDAAAYRYQRFGPGQYFTSQFVNCLDVDQDGSIWTGTDDKGLYLIQWEAAMTVNILMDSPLDCKTAQPTGALSVKVSGGEPPFTYAWSNGQATDKIAQLAAGEYTLTVTDSKGFVKKAKYAIPDPSISVAFEIIKPSSGSATGDASVNLLVNGGTGNMVYKWDDGEDTQLATRLTAGPHAVTITDENGCTATTAFNVPEQVTPLSITLTLISENKCANASDGVIQADVSGGKAPLKYKWSQGSQTDGMLRGMPSGTFTVTVTDASGQSGSASLVITAPPPVVVTAELISAAGVGINNGQAQVKATGGKGPYTYKWDHGETITSVKNLSSGLHVVSVTDANGCITTATVNVSENITSLSAAVKQTSQIKCHGETTAALTSTISGGKGPYTYAWSDGQTTEVAENLKAGSYSLTVTDVVGNKFTSTAVVSQPDPILVTITADAPASTNGADGKATAKATGGTGPFQFAWDTGEKINKALKLGAGSHIVTVTDAAGCISTASMDITENILPLQITIEQTAAVKCAGTSEGSVKAIVRGGKEPYTFKWNNEISSGSIQNLGDGLYNLTVTDAMGHTATSVITVNSPKPITVTAKVDAAAATNQSNGKASVTVTGGTGKYIYAWDNGEQVAKAVSLGAGNHTVTVTDENGCTGVSSVTILENITPIVSTIKQNSKIACAGNKNASLQVEVNGGKPPYTYSWTSQGQEWKTDKIENLAAGMYSLQVTDVTGTVSSSQFEVTEPKPLQVTAEEIIPASTGNTDGQVTLKATGGTAGYSLDGAAWPSGINTYNVDQLKPGDHTLIVKDAAGCTAEVKVNITENILPLTVSIKQTQKILCAGTAAANLESTVKGGKAPYTYSWNNNPGTATISNLDEGTYTLVVNDVSGLKGQAEFKVTAPPKLVAEISNLRSATNDRLKDGKGTVSAKGGTGPYTYLWSSGETTNQATGLPLGPGQVIITDANGCTASADYVIKEKALPELTADRLASGEPIRMEKIQFDADSIKIKSDAIPSLDELYEFLYDHPTVIIEVSGHTNGLPADDYCDRISAERAQSVADYITSKGIEPKRVISKGYGKRKPVATNQTPEGRKKNQRVEIRLIKIEE